VLNKLVEGPPDPVAAGPDFPSWYRPALLQEVAETLGPLWSQVINCRNDLAHCGMKPQPLPADKVKGRVDGFLGTIGQLLSGP